MSVEFQGLQTQGTWDLVQPSSNQNVLGRKWIFKTKYNSDGLVARHKERLVSQGFKQEHELDYTKNFNQVAKMSIS